MLRGLATVSFWADDLAAAKEWCAELLGIDPYFERAELVLRYQLHADHLTLNNPSRWVSASVEAFGMGGWIHFHPGTDREEPPIVSEAPS